jgi:hypothetical protein
VFETKGSYSVNSGGAMSDTKILIADEKQLEDMAKFINEDLRRELNQAIKERDEARGVVLACHRAFNSGSDFVRQEAKRLAAKIVKDATP